jgi:hypothetical protein
LRLCVRFFSFVFSSGYPPISPGAHFLPPPENDVLGCRQFRVQPQEVLLPAGSVRAAPDSTEIVPT